jgi:glycosyltransferase involved in cell wall biosynthesis
LVSIIVPTLNSSKTLAMCLQSIRQQTYKQIEVLIVDGGSSDNTIEIAKKYEAKVKKASIRNRSVQRNMGAEHSKGEFLFYVDSDEVLHPNIVEECVKQMVEKKLDGVFVTTIDTGSSYFGKSRSLGDVIHIKFDSKIRIPNSALRFCSKRLFTDLNGYDDKLVIGEDVVIALTAIKRGFKLGRCNYPVLHYAVEGLGNILTKKFSYGKTFGKFEEEANTLDFSPKMEYIQVGFLFFRNFVKCKKYARYLPGYIIVKVFELSGIALGSFYGYFRENLAVRQNHRGV